MRDEGGMAEAEAVVQSVEAMQPVVALSEALAEQSDRLKPRIDEAVERSEFASTPEVRRAIEGYYGDHYKFATVIESILKDKQSTAMYDAVSDGIFNGENLTLNKALQKLSDPSLSRTLQLRKTYEMTLELLFNEVAIGITTLDERELDKKYQLLESIRQQAMKDRALFTGRDGGQFWGENEYKNDFSNLDKATPQRIKEKLDFGIERFWGDGRFAGQLEFHNTPFMEDMLKDGFTLRTKTSQRLHAGDYQSTTLDIPQHSETIHFCESYMAQHYKSVVNGKQVDFVTMGSTIAIPLAEVVRIAPYARHAEYAEVELKTDGDKLTVIDDTLLQEGGYDTGNPGQGDNKPTRHGIDRTFYADARDRSKGEDYAIPFGQLGRSPQGSTTHIIVTQADIDAAHKKKYIRDASNVDHLLAYGSGEGFPTLEVLPFDRDITIKEPGRMFIDEINHHHSANVLGMTDPRLSRVSTENFSFREGVSAEQQVEEVKQQIAEMQKESRNHPKYRGKAVVRLRGDVMAFNSQG